jgi:hypothetical protein
LNPSETGGCLQLETSSPAQTRGEIHFGTSSLALPGSKALAADTIKDLRKRDTAIKMQIK